MTTLSRFRIYPPEAAILLRSLAPSPGTGAVAGARRWAVPAWPGSAAGSEASIHARVEVEAAENSSSSGQSWRGNGVLPRIRVETERFVHAVGILGGYVVADRH